MNLEELEYKELKAKAVELGIEIKGNPKREDLEEEVRVAIENAEMLAKEAKYEKPSEDSKKVVENTKSAASTRQSQLQLKKVVITPLDERLKNVPSELVAVGNGKTGFIKKVVKFNTESLEPVAILNLLKERQMLIQESFEKNGKVHTRKRMVPAYNVREMPFTQDDLEAIEAKFGEAVRAQIENNL